jgi:hypothetical protein
MLVYQQIIRQCWYINNMNNFSFQIKYKKYLSHTYKYVICIEGVFTMLRFYLLHISPYMFTQILISCFKHILPYVCPIGGASS